MRRAFLRCTIVLVVLLTMTSGAAFGQSFGKNKVQYEEYDWEYIQSDHFDVYFYEGGRGIAEFAADAAETAYVTISHQLRYRLKKRISIIIYNSHNDFQTTNVSLGYMTEGIGGFTELFKNRVVLPFEGTYKDFRRVIHHELVHAMINDMVYGGSVQSVVSGKVTLNIPAWFNEGFAEYSASEWDTKSDMFMRDLAVNNELPPITRLRGYYAYKGGQSVMKYIADKYGEEKIGEILARMKGTRGVESGFKAAIGQDLEELSKKWQKALKQEYWPDIADRKDPEEISLRLTDHIEMQNIMNVSPAISPGGGKIAFLSDKSGYADIYLMSAVDGKIIDKLVSGQRSPDFEELKWLSPGLSWSPDGTRIVFAAKSGDRDGLFTLDVETKEIKKYKFDLDGIFTAAWSPQGDEIAFVGNNDGASDIYLFNLKTETLENLTRDIFSDAEPAWSPDGKRIAFVSDRRDYLKTEAIPEDFKMQDFNNNQTDIYMMNSDGSDMERITDTGYDEGYPIWTHKGNALAFTSDRNGIWNIWMRDFDKNEQYPLTDILTGVFQLSLSGDDSKLAFSAFSKSGWDVYVLKNPFKGDHERFELEKTSYFSKLEEGENAGLADKSKRKKREGDFKADGSGGYEHYIFAGEFINDTTYTEVKPEPAALDSGIVRGEDGTYISQDYKTKFSLDLVDGVAGYSTFFGFQGTTVMYFSDVLGDHQIQLGADFLINLENSDYFLTYFYLPRQINYGITGFHTADFFNGFVGGRYVGLVRYRTYGIGGIISRPYSKFRRLDLSLTWFNVSEESVDPGVIEENISTFLPELAIIDDTVLYGFTGPIDGKRSMIRWQLSPKYNSHSYSFQKISIDYRKYWKHDWFHSFAVRVAAGASFGRDAPNFFLGGLSGWINWGVSGDLSSKINVQDLYFSEFITLLRGASFYELIGTRYVLNNLEFRYPLIRRLDFGWPLPLSFPPIMGVLFTDIGAAWDSDGFMGSSIGSDGVRRFDDFFLGYGFGGRLPMGYFMLKLDVAWNYNLNVHSKPRYYFSLGIDF